MDIKQAFELIGKTIFTYEIIYVAPSKPIYIWEEEVLAVGKDFLYTNDKSMKPKKHYFQNYGIKWFTDKNECKKHAEIEKE